MFETFFPIAVLLAIAAGTALIMFTLSIIVGKRVKGDVKGSPYESGVEPIGDTKDRFSVKFFLVAILFIVFDLEVVFLYPWAVISKELALFGLIEMFVFIGILFIAYIYILRVGALKWE
ncbi:MAG: NADH-quinone oxidoreductase subunit A [candidate division Zixibacteria bacterium]|nr:NADH-quinone oxidoreductase subunit A [candidate division Zixibacteria bacterium]